MTGIGHKFPVDTISGVVATGSEEPEQDLEPRSLASPEAPAHELPPAGHAWSKLKSGVVGVLLGVMGVQSAAATAQELPMTGQWQGAQIERSWEAKVDDPGLVGAVVLSRLVFGEVLPDGTKLDTALPVEVRTRAMLHDDLRHGQFHTYGQLLGSLLEDADGDGLPDVVAKKLEGIFLPGQTAAFTQALSKRVAPDVIADLVADVGYTDELPDGWSGVASLEPPAAFGLDGQTSIDLFRQQVLLRLGGVLMDMNANGKLDASDLIIRLDAHGNETASYYGELDQVRRGLVELNQAIVETIYEYESSGYPVNFSSPSGGQSKETVNPDYWKVHRSAGNSSATWELEGGKRPSDAIEDTLFVNAAEYTTDCAQMQTVVSLAGLKHHYTRVLGDGAGSFRFDAEFPKTEAQGKAALDYLAGFVAAKGDNSALTWDAYVQQHPPPELDYALSITRHHLFSGGSPSDFGALALSAAMSPWDSVESAGAPGDTGYFANKGASMNAARSGYLGENVILTGFHNGKLSAWGHPGQSYSEEAWAASVAGAGVIQSMSAFGEYFRGDTERAWIITDTQGPIDRSEERIGQLEAEQPQNWQRSRTVAERQAATAKTERAVRLVIADPDHLRADKLDTLRTFFEDGQLGTSVEDARPLVEGLTAEGQARLVEAFLELEPHIDPNLIESLLPTGSSPLLLSDFERAALAVNLGIAQLGYMPIEFRIEGDRFLDIAEFGTQKQLLETGGLKDLESFDNWLGTDPFRAWYQERSGQTYAGPSSVEELSQQDVQGIVELAFPMTDRMRTIYGEVNNTSDQLSEQMAKFLKHGEAGSVEKITFGTSRVPRT